MGGELKILFHIVWILNQWYETFGSEYRRNNQRFIQDGSECGFIDDSNLSDSSSNDRSWTKIFPVNKFIRTRDKIIKHSA